MRKLPLLSLLVGLFALPPFAAETYKDASVVEVKCSKKRSGGSGHPRWCLCPEVRCKWLWHRHPGQGIPEVRCQWQRQDKKSFSRLRQKGPPRGGVNPGPGGRPP